MYNVYTFCIYDTKGGEGVDSNIIVRVDRKKKARLFRILRADGVGFSEWIRMLIDRRLERERKKRRKEKHGQKAKRKPRS